jgi:hypothetical protein
MTQTNVIGKRVQAARDVVGIRRVLVAARSDCANTSINGRHPAVNGRRPAVDLLLVLAVNQGLIVMEPVQVGPICVEILGLSSSKHNGCPNTHLLAQHSQVCVWLLPDILRDVQLALVHEDANPPLANGVGQLRRRRDHEERTLTCIATQTYLGVQMTRRALKPGRPGVERRLCLPRGAKSRCYDANQ